MQARLNDILQDAAVKQIIGPTNLSVERLVFDSRIVRQGDVFFAIRGTTSDGHQYIANALAQGAIAIVCEHLPEFADSQCTWILVENSAYSLAKAAAAFYGHPSRKLKLTGVTGTNGKTTIATLLHQLFDQAGYPSGLISTICNKIGRKIIPSTHTTPDPVSLNALLSEMVEAGCSHVFMEVSSHAMTQMRTFGLQFAGAIFTNLTHDHLDYHGTFSAYRDAKKLFFDLLGSESFALVNADDKNGLYMVQNTHARVSTYSLNGTATFKAKILENNFEGLILNLDGNEVYTQLIGRFNAYNLTAIYGAALLLGMERETVLRGLSLLQSAEGRFDQLRSTNGITAIVDYAHTPDALLNVLKTIGTIRTHNEQLITVAGAGGNRDKTKRPEMARVAVENSNLLILTSDNPRNEDPMAIIDDMRKGIPGEHFKKYIVIADRREAIKTAVMMAKPGDIILIAGKGHEKYQEIKGVKFPFDDKEEVIQLFNHLQKP